MNMQQQMEPTPQEAQLQPRLQESPADVVRILHNILVARDRELDRTAEGIHEIPGSAPLPALHLVAERMEKAIAARFPRDGRIPEGTREAMDFIYRCYQSVSRKWSSGSSEFGFDDIMCCYTIVLTDGTRPSIPLESSLHDAMPLIEAREHHWNGAIRRDVDLLQGIADATGRIEPGDGSPENFYGTGFLVAVDASALRGLVLTNWHVLDAIQSNVRREDSYDVCHDVYVDFDGSPHSDGRKRFKVISGRPSGVLNHEKKRLDIATLEIDVSDHDNTPTPMTVRADAEAPRGETGAIYVIGFPKRREHRLANWEEIHKRIFIGSRYGIKSIAPGVVHRPLGSAVLEDSQQWIFGHDASTLGGCSGAPVLTVRGAHGAFGIHFSGNLLKSNLAIAASATAGTLVDLGVPVKPVPPRIRLRKSPR